MIRLTLILIAGLVGAMLVFGEETPQVATETIAETVLDGEPEVPVVEAVVIAEPEVVQPVVVKLDEEEAVVVAEPDVVVETAKLDSLDLTGTSAFDGLLVVKSIDLSADAELPIKVEPQESAEEPSSPNKLFYVTGNSVNLRAGPSTGVAVVGNLRRGAEAEFIEKAADGWWQIRDVATGKTGYMAARFLAPVDPG